MTSKQRAYLKSLAMTMDPIFQIGKGSLTPENTSAIAEALAVRELIKINVLQNCMDDPKELARTLAERTHSQVVQVIGKKIVLYKERQEKNRTSTLRGGIFLKKEKARKIGIMGGTFDPIHIGHLILGENAWHQFGLEKVLFMPSANPPHKPNRIGRADIQERVDMVRGAIADNPHFELSLEEAFREDYCYTSETLQEMTVKHPDTEYYFIMGADSLFAFETWHEPQKICQNCVIVAAVRDHVSAEHFKEQIEYLTQKYQVDIRILATPNIDVSSHEIREWIRKANTSLKYYVPDKVISYIKEKNLYSECKE